MYEKVANSRMANMLSFPPGAAGGGLDFIPPDLILFFLLEMAQ